VVGLGGVIYALTDGSAHGFVTVRVLIVGTAGVVALAALVPVERGLRAPMLRLSLFASRQFDAINVTTVFFYGVLSAVSYLLILQYELQLGYSASQAGAALIPSSVIFIVISPLSGMLVSRIGPKWLMVAGILTSAAAFVWLSAAQSGSSYWAAILPPVAVWGLGLGLTVAPLTAAVLAAVSDPDLGEASAINDATSRIGGVVFIAAVPVLIGATGGQSLAHALADGYQPAMIVLAAVCVLAAGVTALFVSNERASS
jgi:MFS family permease